MASMNCKCGETLSNNAVPNNIQLWVYTDKEWDSLTTPEAIETWSIHEPTYDVWRCPTCERIYFFGKENLEAIKVYKIEE